MNIRLLPPVSAGQQMITLNGRLYSSTPGHVVDVIDADALTLTANGWLEVAPSGPTASRPTAQFGPYTNLPGATYYDTTLSKLIISDGVSWRDPSNGNAV